MSFDVVKARLRLKPPDASRPSRLARLAALTLLPLGTMVSLFLLAWWLSWKMFASGIEDAPPAEILRLALVAGLVGFVGTPVIAARITGSRHPVWRGAGALAGAGLSASLVSWPVDHFTGHFEGVALAVGLGAMAAIAVTPPLRGGHLARVVALAATLGAIVLAAWLRPGPGYLLHTDPITLPILALTAIALADEATVLAARRKASRR